MLDGTVYIYFIVTLYYNVTIYQFMQTVIPQPHQMPQSLVHSTTVPDMCKQPNILSLEVQAMVAA